MPQPLSDKAPDLTTTVALRDGREVLVRPLASSDTDALTRYLLGLSDRTRSMYGPHPFDAETAARICGELDSDTAVRFVALLASAEEPTIVGYAILDRKTWDGDARRYGDMLAETCASLAPSIADAFQEQGLGTAMCRHILHCARLLGLNQVILMGGVVRENTRAVRLYERLGFQRVGEFVTRYDIERLNEDMILYLAGSESQ